MELAGPLGHSPRSWFLDPEHVLQASLAEGLFILFCPLACEFSQRPLYQVVSCAPVQYTTYI